MKGGVTMKRIGLFLFGLVLLHPDPSSAVIRHVPGQYLTVQAAINAGLAGDTVLVQPGRYLESIDFLGKAILVGSLYATSGDTSHVSRTVIAGGMIIGTHVVTFANGETPSSRLSGFTITEGTATDGAGIYCHETSPTLDHLRVTHNHAQNSGGGIYAYGGMPMVMDCRITDNTAGGDGDGGGIWAQYSDIIIQRNEIHRNRCGFRGAGIFCEHSYQTITDNRITENIVDGPNEYNGGGITSRNCAPLIANNFISGNDGGGYAGGLFY
jgi:hypothetical protein